MDTKRTGTTDPFNSLREAITRVMKGQRDPEAVKAACERMDRMREEIRQKHGVLDIAVPSIRELRDR